MTFDLDRPDETAYGQLGDPGHRWLTAQGPYNDDTAELTLFLTAGGVFDAGEVLLRIDPTNYGVAVEQAEALVKQRQIEYDGASKLREQGYRAEAELASAAAALATANADLVRARRDGRMVYYSLADDHVATLMGTGIEHANE